MPDTNLSNLRKAHEAVVRLLEKSLAVLKVRWNATILGSFPPLTGEDAEAFKPLGREEAAGLLQDFYAALGSLHSLDFESKIFAQAGQPASWAGIESLCAHVWVADFAAHIQDIIKLTTGVVGMRDANGLREDDLSFLLDKLDKIRAAMPNASAVNFQAVYNRLESEWIKVERIMKAEGVQREGDLKSILAIFGQENIAIFNIAHDASKTTDQKMAAIYAVDNRVLAWDSPQWAELLGVSDAAVRKTDWWKRDRSRLKG